MKVNILSNRIPWFGKYSGYDCLPYYFSKQLNASITYNTDTKLNRILGKVVRTAKGIKDVRSDEVWAETKFIFNTYTTDVSHILLIENHIHLFRKNYRTKFIGTVHQPISRWQEKDLQSLANTGKLILLFKEEIQEFSKYKGEEDLRFIRHGVDTSFFKPGRNDQINKNKILFIGHYLRNFDMLYRVYNIICREINDQYEFHFIIPAFYRSNKVLVKLGNNHNVFFHEKLTDEELLLQYQSSNLLLMPMADSGANSAIIQAISAGLPVLTTDVGGIRSYGGGCAFPVVKNDDNVNMVELFYKYTHDINYRNTISEGQRAFAIDCLDWHTIANEHLNVYKAVL